MKQMKLNWKAQKLQINCNIFLIFFILIMIAKVFDDVVFIQNNLANNV